ncbi:hypothetical protein [Sphaerotilus sp.]|uniref:hypothetical protein n=1 Tax=Sphaerotilus sp. TaxID=2093942 RepID=UPI00286E64CE|nr:hypothetical protein [Sphaerotilus sp.]
MAIDQILVDDDFSEIEALAAAMAAAGSSIFIGPIAAKLPSFIRTLANHCPIKTAAAFGGILTQKRLQTNCLRLEILVHLSLIFGGGKRAPTQSLLNQGFSSVGALCGHLEDPREDVFVGNVYSKNGNYRVFEGIWEGATFYLQRIVNLTDSLPDEGDLSKIKESVHSLLKLSDFVCEKAKLTRNDIGPDGKNNTLPKNISEKSAHFRALVGFNREELTTIGVDINALSPFIFESRLVGRLTDQAISNTDLEAAPLVFQDGTLYMLLPTAVSVAIRRYFVRLLGENGNRKVLLSELGYEYSTLFSTSRFFGEVGPRLPFVHQSWGSLCAITQEIDAGRHLNMVFFLDDLIGFEEDGFGGAFHGGFELRTETCKAIESMQIGCERREGFKDGITLVIGCGIGRGVVLEGFHQPRPQWAWEFVGVCDLISLAHVDGVQLLDLWRVRRMESFLRQRGVMLQNMNGLLNLFAWADSLDGHLVPHGEIPRDFQVGDVQLFIPITQNGLSDLRHGISIATDEHVENFVDGTWKLLRKERGSYFDQDTKHPLYVHLEQGKNRRLLGAKITKARCWWYAAFTKDGSANRLTYDRWAMMGVWVARAVDMIDARFHAEIGEGPVYWKCVFDGDPESNSFDEFGGHEDLADAFSLNIDLKNRTIELHVGSGFDRAIYHPHNIAEVGLVKAFLGGISKLAGVEFSAIEAAVAFAWSDVNARHSHIFSAKSYRDYFREILSTSPITISKFDDALIINSLTKHHSSQSHTGYAYARNTSSRTHWTPAVCS